MSFTVNLVRFPIFINFKKVRFPMFSIVNLVRFLIFTNPEKVRFP
jgi:hypothetical protein